MNFSEIFSTDSSKNRLIEIYHQFKDKTNLYDRFWQNKRRVWCI